MPDGRGRGQRTGVTGADGRRRLSSAEAEDPLRSDLFRALVVGASGIPEVARTTGRPRGRLLRMLDARLGEPSAAASGHVRPWEILLYLLGSRELGRVRRREVAMHVATCRRCRWQRVRTLDLVAAVLAGRSGAADPAVSSS